MDDIQDKPKQAIAIDVERGTVTVKHMSWADAQKHVGGYLEMAPGFGQDGDVVHDLFVDEEGLLKGYTSGFELRGERYVGNGVIFGRSQDVDGWAIGDCALKPETLGVKFWRSRRVR